MATTIARYLFNEASTGTTPTTVADSSGNGNNLSITYNGSASWTSVGAGNGLDFTAAPITTNSAKAEISNISANGSIGSSLDGATQCSFILVVDVDAGSASGSRIFQLGTDTGNGELALVEGEFDLFVRIDGNTAATFPQLSGLGLQVVTCVIDTTEAVQADRVKVWYNNVEQTAIVADTALNATIDANNSSFDFVLGNRPSANRNFDGKMYYFELFSDKLTAQEISDSATALAADNDSAGVVADVTAPVLSLPTASSPTDVQASGTVTTDEGNGTLYYYASQNSSETAATIKASGSSQAVSATGVQNVTVTGLTQETTYYIHYVHDDSSSNESNVVSSSSFTTLVTQATITNIDVDNDVRVGQVSVQITGSNFGTVTSVTLGGESLTLNSNNNTVVNVDIPTDIDLRWGRTDLDLVVINTVGSGTLSNVTLSNQVGWETVSYDGPAPDAPTTESFFEEAQTDSEILLTMGLNDLLAWETQTGLEIDAQTIPVVNPPATVSGSYRIWDESAGTWFGPSTFTIVDGGAADATPPSLTAPTAAETSDTTATGSVSTNEGNGTLYYYASTNATESVGDVKTNGASVTVSSTGARVVNFAGLTANTTYYAHYVQDDAFANTSTVVSSPAFTTQAAPDTTAPILSTPTSSVIDSVSGSGTVITNESGGTLYFYFTENATETAASIKASGNSQPVSAAGVQNVSRTGIDPETTYYIHYVQDDASSNESNVVSSASFTTPTDTPAVQYTFTIAEEDHLVTASGARVNMIVPIWELWTNAPEETGAVKAASGIDFILTNGVGSVTTTGVEANTNYVLVLRSQGRTPTTYGRVVGELT